MLNIWYIVDLVTTVNTVGRVQIVNGTPVLHATVVHLLYTSQL